MKVCTHQALREVFVGAFRNQIVIFRNQFLAGPFFFIEKVVFPEVPFCTPLVLYIEGGATRKKQRNGRSSSYYLPPTSSRKPTCRRCLLQEPFAEVFDGGEEITETIVTIRGDSTDFPPKLMFWCQVARSGFPCCLLFVRCTTLCSY